MRQDLFSDSYWEHNYSNPSEMDGIANAKEHARYAKNFFDIEMIHINSMMDLGAGLGFLLASFVKEFVPYEVKAIEPSNYAFKELKQKQLKIVDGMKVSLSQSDLYTWCKSKDEKKVFDLGICTSVLQYIETDKIEKIVPVLAKRFKYLYLSVPTDKELDRQKDECEFHDHYAIRRSKTKYYKLLSTHFTFVSARILESKEFFNELDTDLTDLLFRF
ncbi:MAG: class I SAM-dependent methyltransferase [Halobacteriovoraceae bacterium]|nr:class I SAM-dependent methyltransferase [Halobacteriovoraceae bacterium]